MSESQKRLIEKFVLQDKRQFQDYEIGGYKAIWGRDITVLITKKIIRELTYGLYEINKEYFDCMRAHFDANGSGEQV